MSASFWRRTRAFLVPKSGQDSNAEPLGFGWGWLVFISVLGIALYVAGRSPSAAANMPAVILISLPISALIYFRLRKWIIEKGRFGKGGSNGSFWAGLIALPICAFVAGLIAGLSSPRSPAGEGPRVGPTEALLLLTFVVIVVGTVLIVHFINKRSKKSKRDGPANGHSIAPFSSPEAAAKWTRVLLAVTLMLAAVAVVSGVMQIELLSRIARGDVYTMAEATRSDSRQQIVGILQILLLVGTAVAFLIWFHRAYKNLPSLGQKRFTFSPGWVVGFFFIPFLNFVRPFQAMRELWHGSDPGHRELEAPSDGPGIPDRLPTPPLVGWWWGLFLTSNIIANIAARLFLSASASPDDVQTGTVLMAISDLLDIPGALVAIILVGRLTRWQGEKARLIGQGGGQVAADGDPFSRAEVRKKSRENILIVVVGLLLVPMFASLFFFTRGRDGDGEPPRVYVEGQYFTVGSTREDVLRIQGPPTLKLEFVWYYGDSYVQFDSDGKVNDVWNYAKNLKVKPWKTP